ncbi:MAG: (Fe-S)-binding protein, partial [Chloroflexota bacterium]
LLVAENASALAGAEFKTIVTTDPHSLNALRHEYPSLADRTPVMHVTELLADLLTSGRLPVRRPIARAVTYHAPCYLARYNRVIAEPRAALRAIGARLVEMPRHGLRTHCCGAGGGAIWKDQKTLKERPSENRIREALALDGVSDFVVACPKDVTMFEAAVVATGAQERLRVFDLAELVDDATRPDAVSDLTAPVATA